MRRIRNLRRRFTGLALASTLLVASVAVALLGDLTGDAVVNDTDAQHVLQAVVGIRTLTPQQAANADVDGDGDVDVFDAQLIQRFAAGIIAGFPVRLPQQSAPIAVSRDGAIVGVVNPDGGTATFLSAASDLVLGEVAVGREPIGIAFSRNGTRAYVTNARDATVAVVDTSTFAVVKTIPVGVEPFGIVVNFRGDRAYVSNLASGSVSVVDLATETVAATVPVASKPQGLAVTADSSAVYVTHLNGGQVSRLDAATLSVTSIPLAEIAFDADNPTTPAGTPNRMKGIAIHPTRNEAWLPHLLSNSDNFVETLFNTTIFPAVRVLDVATNLELVASRMTLFAGLATTVSNPEAVAFSPDGQRAFVVSAASNDLTAINVDTRQEVGVLRDVGDNPRGIAVHPSGQKAYVFNRLTPAVSVVDLTSLALLRTVPVGTDPLPPNIANGRRLFFTSAPREVAQDRFFGCEACHFDGRDDGQTWFFTNGPRQTLTLAGGTLHTGLLHHNADRKDVQDFAFTFTRLQNGTGLSEDQLDDLAAFVNEGLRFLENPFLQADGSRTAAARRGRRVFQRAQCATCHSGPFLTDADGRTDPAAPLLHDVGIFAPGAHGQDAFDKTRDQDGVAAGVVRPAGFFESTFLNGVWATAPYLHDGRSATLLHTLTTGNPTDRHGVTSTLTGAERADLVAYLEQLDITNARVAITFPVDGARVTSLSRVAGRVLEDVTAVDVFVAGAGPFPATVANGTFEALVTPPLLGPGQTFDVTANAVTAGGEPGRDDVALVANIGAAGTVSAAQSTVEAMPAMIRADGMESALVVVTPRDAGGQAVGSGLAVRMLTTLGTLTPVVDAGDGRYVAELVSTPIAGIAVISAGLLVGPLFADTASVDFAPGGIDADTSLVSALPTTLEASAVARATVTIVPRDAFGNDLGGGHSVLVSTNRGSVGPVTDQGDGAYAATYTAATAPGIATVTATVNGVPLTQKPQITLVTDVTPPPAPNLARITFATPAGGVSRITGGAGAVEAQAIVLVQNTTTAAAPVQIGAGADGSFSVDVAVTSNQTVCVRARDAAGNTSPAACTVPFPVEVFAVRGVVRAARPGGGFNAVANALVELDVANLLDPFAPSFTPVFAGGQFLTDRTAADGTFEIVLPAGFAPDPDLAVVTGPDSNNDGLVDDLTAFSLVNAVERTVTVDEIATTIPFLIGSNDQLCGTAVLFPESNFTPAERTAIDEALRPATTEVVFFGQEPLQAIADDVFFDVDGPPSFADLVARETFCAAAASPGTEAPPTVIQGSVTIPGTGGPLPLANVIVNLATLSFSGCGQPICVAPIAGAEGTTDASGAFSLTLPGFVVPGSTAVTVVVGDLLYNGSGQPGPFNDGVSVFSLGTFVTNTQAPIGVDIAGRIAMSLIRNTGAPIENFNPVELDDLLVLVRQKLAGIPLVLANRTLQQVFIAAFNAIVADLQVSALLNDIKDAESGADNSRVTADPTTLEADGVSFATITVEPLGPTSERVGPGLLVELSTTLGTITTPALDNHDGTYTAFLRAPTAPGTATVTARVEGVALTQRPAVVFTPDTHAPAAPAAARIVLVNGGPTTVTVIGLPGAVEPFSLVTVENLTRGLAVTVRAAADGSFRVDITASPGDQLRVRVADAANNVSPTTARPNTGSIALPAIANPAAVPAGVTPALAVLGEGGLGVAVPAGFSFVGGFMLDLDGASATAPLDVMLEATASIPAGAHLLLVQVLELRAGAALRVVGPAQQAGGVLFPRGGARFPGVRTEGRYAVLATTQPHAFVTGQVAGSRGPTEGVHMSLDVSPFVDLTRGDGAYLLAGPLGGGRVVSARLLPHVTPTQAIARLPFTDAEVDCDFTLATRATVSFGFTGRFAALGQVARRMAVLPSGRRLYVAEGTAGDVAIVDTATMSVAGVSDDTQSLVDVATAPNGFEAFLAYFSRVRDFTIGIEEPGVLLAGVGFPRSLTITPNSDLALVGSSLDNNTSNATPDALFVVDTFTNVVAPGIPVPADPVAVAVNRVGARAYVVSGTQGRVTIVDLATRLTIAEVLLGGTLSDVTVAPDGTELYIADAAGGRVVVLDATLAEDAVVGNETRASIAVGGAPNALALSPAGTQLLVSEQLDDTVSVVDVATRTVARVWAVADLPADVVVHPDGKRAYVLDQLTGRGVLEVPLATADATAPGVLDAGPQDRAGTLLQDSPLEVTFTERMNVATFTPANVVVRDAQSAVVPGTLAAAGDGVAVVFTPSAGVRYRLNSALQVTLGTGLTDAAGLPLPAAQIRTVPTFPMQAPNLTRITVDLSTAGISASGTAGAVHAGATVEVRNLTTAAVFRTTAAANGAFTLALQGLDSDGFELVTSLFGGRARTDALPLPVNFHIQVPNPTLVSYQPGPAGTLLASGAAGAVDPQATRVVIRNRTSGQQFQTTAVAADGSFAVGVLATQADTLDLVVTILGAIDLDPVLLASPTLPPPAIDFVTPERFVFGDAVTLAIVGRDFGAIPGNVRLQVGGAVRTDFTIEPVDGDPTRRAIVVGLPVGTPTGEARITHAGQVSNPAPYFAAQPPNTSPFAESVVDASVAGNPASILGQSDATFVDLGAGGFIVVELGSTVRDGAGSDLQVFEDGADGQDCYRVLVSASAAGPFDLLGTFCGTQSVDLAGHDPVRFVRIEDAGDGGNAARVGAVFALRVEPSVSILLDGQPLPTGRAPAAGFGPDGRLSVNVSPGDSAICAKDSVTLSASITPPPQGGGGYSPGCTDTCTWDSDGGFLGFFPPGTLTPNGCSATYTAGESDGQVTIDVKVSRSGNCSDAGATATDSIRLDIANVEMTNTNESGAVLDPMTTVTTERVAVRTDLKASLEGPSATPMWEWTVGGSTVKEYTHDIDDDRVIQETANWKMLEDADKKMEEISFHWTAEGTMNGVTAKATFTAGGQTKMCSTTVTFNVAHDPDPGRNVYSRDGEERFAKTFRSINSHENWHEGLNMAAAGTSANSSGQPPSASGAAWGDDGMFDTPSAAARNKIPYNGSAFLFWHRRYLDAYFAWRSRFSLPSIPGPFTAPAAVLRPTYLQLSPPPGSSAPSRVYGFTRLGQYPGVEELGEDTVSPWHNGGHPALVPVGGMDMGGLVSPRANNNTFWRWHHEVDAPRREHLGGVAVPRSAADARTLDGGRSAIDPSRVVATSPAPGAEVSGRLREVVIGFDQRVSFNAPPINTIQVTPDKLRVNGSPATALREIVPDSGPLAGHRFKILSFTGFVHPGKGPVSIELLGTAGYEGTRYTVMAVR